MREHAPNSSQDGCEIPRYLTLFRLTSFRGAPLGYLASGMAGDGEPITLTPAGGAPAPVAGRVTPAPGAGRVTPAPGAGRVTPAPGAGRVALYQAPPRSLPYQNSMMRCAMETGGGS